MSNSFEQPIKREKPPIKEMKEKLDKAEKMVEGVEEEWKEKIEESEVKKSVRELKKLWEESEAGLELKDSITVYPLFSSLPLPEIPPFLLERTSNKFLKEFDWKKFEERENLDRDLGIFLSAFLRKNIENYILSQKKKGIEEDQIKPIEVHLKVKELPIRLNCLGYQNPKRLHLVIEGNVRDDTGRKMEGGKVIVEGNCGHLTGNCMRDGEIIVKGNCRNCTGQWMKGGKIIVEGDCGEGTAADMEGGELDIKGDVKSFAEFGLSGHNKGTIIWKGTKIWENGKWGRRYWKAGGIPIAKGV